jgi:MFS family permease
MDGPRLYSSAISEDVRAAAARDARPPVAEVTSHPLKPPMRRAVLFTIEALASAGTNLLISGIYFYMAHHYGWRLLDNFLLAAGQGLVYIGGALASHSVLDRLGTRRALAISYGLMSAMALGCVMARSSAAVTVLLLAYSGISVITWPILEGLVSVGLDSELMSRRISSYNLVWSAVGVVMLALDGMIIQHWPVGVFVIPAIVHAASMLIVLAGVAEPKPEHSSKPASNARDHASRSPVAAPRVAPELLRVRTLAMWLSRVALPATYVVIFGLMSLMPSLPVMRKLDATSQTALCSIWMFSRWLAFLALGLTTWWHARPRVLIGAAVVMLVAFLGVTLRPSDLLGHGGQAADLLSLAMWQLVLGVCLGIIYAGSLYFGMVLSDGSTEHGGYHEALIGLGMVLGPGAGAAAQWVEPGSRTGILAVGSVIALSVGAVMVTSFISTRRQSSAGTMAC